MYNTTKYLAFCLEAYKKSKKLSGKGVIALFNQYGVIDYIINNYGALHTTGEQYLVQDIDGYIANRNILLPHSNAYCNSD
ncbi:hypothetical protein AGMMS49938_14710 [Fibrobacterales bacterium]|nr:hypothetical protein AGMMS49938_14650 [Fibrobacterales bacterium]GHV15723.1 hypothetical protein AGMMS49938_14710 [Fibrobacterales bacterium]